MQVIIPLAGKGTRLRPHTHTTPKPLLHVAGKPVISYILDDVARLNPSQVIFLTGHLKEKIEEYIRRSYTFPSMFVEQKVQDGTAGAIRLARPHVKEPILIIYVDTIFEADLGEIARCKDDGIIWAKAVEDYQRFGVIVLENNFMRKIVEKPSEPISKLANIGVYYVANCPLLFEGIEHVYARNLMVRGEYYLTDAFQYMVDHGAKIRVAPVAGWYDCGDKKTLLETNRHFLASRHRTAAAANTVFIPPVYIEDGALIEDSVIGPYVSVAAGARIAHSIVSNSIVGPLAVITEAHLAESLVGEAAEVEGLPRRINIGDHSQVRV